ncbi:MAG: hypothetical protein JKX94_09040, partial [Sneathiella sp.]|nr:hypothetical protein [Sneathiella sp.]
MSNVKAYTAVKPISRSYLLPAVVLALGAILWLLSFETNCLAGLFFVALFMG